MKNFLRLILFVSFFSLLFSVGYSQKINTDSLIAVWEETKKSIDITVEDLDIVYTLRETLHDINIEKANEILIEAAEIAKKNELPVNQAQFLSLLGRNATMQFEEYRALEYYYRAFEVTKESKDSFTMAYIYTDIGNLYAEEGIWEAATFYFKKGHKVFEEIRNPEGLSYSINKLITAYYYRDMCDSTLFYAQAALKTAKSLSNYHLADAYSNLGKAFNCKKDYDKAVLVHKESIAYIEKAIEEGHLNWAIQNTRALYYWNVALNYERNDQLDSALMFYNINDSLNASLETNYGFSGKYNSRLSKIEFKSLKGEKSEAITLLNAMLTELDTSDILRKEGLQIEALKLLAQILQEKNRFEEAYHALDKMEKIRKVDNSQKMASKLLKFNAALLNYDKSQALRLQKMELLQTNAEKKKLRLKAVFLLILFVIATLFLFLLYKLNAKLRKTNQELNNRNEAIKTILSIIGHDLRNALQPLVGFSDLLISSEVSSTGKHIGRQIKTAAHKSDYILNDLLTWSMLQKNELKPFFVSVNLRKILTEIEDFTSMLLLNKNLKIDSKLDADYVYSDTYMLHTIFRNIFSNAAKYADESSIIKIYSLKKNDKVEIIISNKSKNASLEDVQNKDNLNPVDNSYGIGFIRRFISEIDGEFSIDKVGDYIEVKLLLPTGISTAEKQSSELVANENNLIVANLSELEIILPDLEKLVVNESTSIIEIITPYQQSTSNDVRNWVIKTMEAVYTLNSALYRKQIKTLKEFSLDKKK